MPVKTNCTENFFLGCLCFFHNNPRLAKHYCCSSHQTVAQMAYGLCFDCFLWRHSSLLHSEWTSDPLQDRTQQSWFTHYITFCIFIYIFILLLYKKKRRHTLDLIQWHNDVHFRMANLAHPLLVIHWLGKWCLFLRSKIMSVIKDLYIYKWVIIPYNFCKGLMIFPQL